MMLFHLQPPELVLKNDGHLLRKMCEQKVGYLHAGKTRAKRKAEMMSGNKAVFFDMLQCAANHAAERRVRQCLIADEILRHDTRWPLFA